MKDKTAQPFFLAGYLFALGATAIWSGNFIVARGLSDHVAPVSLAFYRWLTAVVVFAPFALRGVIGQRSVIRQHLPFLALTSFLGVTCFNTFIYVAGRSTTAMNLSLIAITFPVIIVFLSRVLFKEVLSIHKAAGMGMVLLGVVCLITQGRISVLMSISFAAGDLWMLAASFIFALYTILLKFKPQSLSVNTFQFTCFSMGLGFLFPFFLWEQAHAQFPLFTPTTVGAILYVGVFASLAAFIFWNKAIVGLGPSRAGMVYYTLPVFSGILSTLFLGEGMGWIHLVSFLLILSGIFLTNREPGIKPVKKGGAG